ncbi:TPA: phosphoribosylformylglycinamidine synthase subunit PurL, partial [Candidatus Micrarchaeota archaeon]|nr:phosphoribosylformylglycinamidine synthase subunit PurL [Candidatus Micrarchaeota archaeon]
TWSEHCKHKIFNALIAYEGPAGRREKIDSLFKAFIKKSTDEISRKKPGFLLSVFKDNAGIFRFNKDWNIAVKVETHNSPCALDPFGGAVTGIVGVNRDVLGAGLGARPIFNTDVFCFAAPDYAGVYPRVHPKFMLRGVVRGIQDGGNKSGIPTINGSITFDDSFAGKPLVYCGTGGIMPAKLKGGRATHEKKARPGDLVFMVGGRVGKDGIHGATFSSLGLAEDSPVSAVQIGDPFTQKKVIDFVLEVRDAGLVGSITDCGAGGLSSSVGEMALQSGGAELRLEKVPLKYAGLQPWEVLLSEAQERMTIAVSPANREKFLELARKHEVEASEIGVFTKTGFFHVLHSGKPVLHLDLDFLHSPPQLQLKAKARKIVSKPFTPASQKDYSGILKKILFSWNVCSKEEIVRRYDHEVQGTSVLKPFVGAENDGPGDAAVLKPVYSSNEGLVVSHGLSPKYSKLDAYLMAANALDEAVRNAVAVGGSLEKMVCLDNFCWPDPVFSKGNPDGMEKLGDLVEANNALYDLTRAYGVPCVSGKDSMKNDAFVKGKKISVLPTLLFTVVSVVPDVSKSVSMDFKAGGDVVFVLGETRNELGESEFSKALGLKGGCAPAVDGKANKNLYDALEKAVSQGLVASCHDCSDGGFAVALSESAFAGGLGAQVDLRSMLLGEGAAFDVVALFSESSGRFVASASAKNERAFADLMRKHGVKFARVGVVGGKKLSVLGLNGRKILDEGVLELKKAWKSRRWF